MAFTDILPGIWLTSAEHPDWTEDEGGEDGWPSTVSSWSVIAPGGLVLIDPLVQDWERLDAHVDAHGGCVAVVRTVHWHQRSVAEAAARYGAPVCAKPPPTDDDDWRVFDHALRDGRRLTGGLQVVELPRADELALWFPAAGALIVGDVLLREASGELRVCPDSWLDPDGGPDRLRSRLRELAARLPIEHVLVSHGPPRLSGGAAAIRAACDA